MLRRQTALPRKWFVVDQPLDRAMRTDLRRLRSGTGIFVIGKQTAEIRRLVRGRNLLVFEETRGKAARVHNVRELRLALLARTPLILLSPIYPTASHPDWRPLPRMRAAAFARLGGRRLIALGGMNAQRFRRVERLGFQGWAGIRAFRT